MKIPIKNIALSIFAGSAFNVLNAQSVIGQEKNIYEYLPNNNEHLIYHDDWGKNNYKKLLNQFNSQPLNNGEIIFLGNSITAEGEDWGRRFGYSKIKNRGIGGDVTDGVLARLDEIIYFKPRAVFLLIGINDLWNNTPTIPKPAYIGTNIIKITDIIKRRSSDTKVYIQTVLPIHK